MRSIRRAFPRLFSISTDAWAQDDEGHEIVCEIATRLTEPSAPAEIRKPVRIESCGWPDHPRSAPHA